jgi:hypothetical protein
MARAESSDERAEASRRETEATAAQVLAAAGYRRHKREVGLLRRAGRRSVPAQARMG